MHVVYDWCIFSLAPQKVTQLVVSVISDNSVRVQWSPPVRANGILTYYSVLVFNKRAGYNSSSQIDANDDGEVTIHGLSALYKKILMHYGYIYVDSNPTTL